MIWVQVPPPSCTCCMNPASWLVALSLGFISWNVGSRSTSYRIVLSTIYLCQVLGASCNPPRVLDKRLLFPHWPFAHLGNTPGNPAFFLRLLAAGVKMHLKGVKIKTTWTIFTLIINLEAHCARAGKQACSSRALLRVEHQCSPPSIHCPILLTLCLSGRVGISTYGKQLLGRACNKLEIPKLKRPQQGPSSTLANKAAIPHHQWYCNVLFIMEGTEVLTSRESFLPCAKSLQGAVLAYLSSEGVWSPRRPSPSGWYCQSSLPPPQLPVPPRYIYTWVTWGRRMVGNLSNKHSRVQLWKSSQMITFSCAIENDAWLAKFL